MAGWKIYEATNIVREAFRLAKDEIEMLQDELYEWESRMSESDGLSATAKYEEVSEASELLTEIKDEMDMVPESVFDNDEVIRYNEYRRKRYPRWRRMAETVFIIDALTDWLDSRNLDDDEDKKVSGDVIKQDILDAFENIKNSADSIIWPSMY